MQRFLLPYSPYHGARPAWYPLGQEQIVIFDEQENPEVPQVLPISPQPPGDVINPFPEEAQRTQVDGEDFPVSFDFGWLFLDWADCWLTSRQRAYLARAAQETIDAYRGMVEARGYGD